MLPVKCVWLCDCVPVINPPSLQNNRTKSLDTNATRRSAAVKYTQSSEGGFLVSVRVLNSFSSLQHKWRYGMMNDHQQRLVRRRRRHRDLPDDGGGGLESTKLNGGFCSVFAVAVCVIYAIGSLAGVSCQGESS